MDPEIRLRGKKFDFTVPLEGPAQLVSGGAVIEEDQRPEDDALTVYEGDELIRVDVPVFFNGWPQGRIGGRSAVNIYPKVEQVLNLCRGQSGSRPPDFIASGPMPYSGTRFLMDGFPEWREGEGRGGNWLVRQKLTLHLVEWNDPNDVLRFTRGSGKPWFGRVIILQSPMTLVEIAARFLDDPKEAKAIGKLNKIRDVRKKLPAGEAIKLPLPED